MRQGRGVDRVTFTLLLASAVALLLSMLVMLLAADKLAKQRGQQTAITEYSLTLGRLENLLQAGAAATGDQMGVVVAGGEVFSAQLTGEPSGWFATTSTELQAAAIAVQQQWRGLRQGLGDVNLGDARSAASAASAYSAGTVKDALASYEALFNAITEETFSTALLRVVSDIRSSLKNIDYLTDSASSQLPVSAALDAFHASVAALTSLVQEPSGSVLLGYRTRQLLNTFLLHAEALTPERLFETTALVSQTPADGIQSDFQNQLVFALSGARNYRQVLAVEVSVTRRSILTALVCVCAALLLAAMSVWRIRRRQSSKETLEKTTQSKLVQRLKMLTEGQLVDAVVADDQRLDASGEQVIEQTRRVISELVYSSREVADRTADLIAQQQLVLADLQQAESAREQTRQSMAQSVTDGAADVRRLEESASMALMSCSGLQSELGDCAGVAQLGMTAIAEGNAHLDLADSRMSNVANAVRDLNAICANLKQLAERSNLVALNKSLSVAAYSDDVGSDGNDEYVDEMQQLAKQLAGSANEADRVMTMLSSDVEATRQAFKAGESKIDESVNSSREVSHSLEVINTKAIAMLEQIPQSIASVGDGVSRSQALDESLQLLAAVDQDMWERTDTAQQIANEIGRLTAELDASSSRFQLQGREQT